jgi:hypothetical protein
MTENAYKQELGTGEYTVERWMTFLWAEATRNDEDAFRWAADAASYDRERQLVPPEFALVIVGEAVETEMDEIEGVDPDPEKGIFYAGQSFDFYQPLFVGETYEVSAHVSDIERKEGASGEFDLLSTAFEASDSEGEPAFDTTARTIFMR